jgi:hypothetical protein
VKAQPERWPIVSLDDVVNALEEIDQDSWGWLDRRTGKLIVNRDYESFGLQVDRETESDPRFCVDLPAQDELNEPDIVRAFCEHLPEGPAKRDLIKAIGGKAAFRKFKDAVLSHDLKDAWFDYRRAAFRRIAAEWCEANDIRYESGTDAPPRNPG